MSQIWRQSEVTQFFASFFFVTDAAASTVIGASKEKTMLLRTASQEREFIAKKFCKLSFLEGGGCYGKLM